LICPETDSHSALNGHTGTAGATAQLCKLVTPTGSGLNSEPAGEGITDSAFITTEPTGRTGEKVVQIAKVTGPPVSSNTGTGECPGLDTSGIPTGQSGSNTGQSGHTVLICERTGTAGDRANGTVNITHPATTSSGTGMMVLGHTMSIATGKAPVKTVNKPGNYTGEEANRVSLNLESLDDLSTGNKPANRRSRSPRRSDSRSSSSRSRSGSNTRRRRSRSSAHKSRRHRYYSSRDTRSPVYRRDRSPDQWRYRDINPYYHRQELSFGPPVHNAVPAMLPGSHPGSSAVDTPSIIHALNQQQNLWQQQKGDKIDAIFNMLCSGVKATASHPPVMTPATNTGPIDNTASNDLVDLDSMPFRSIIDMDSMNLSQEVDHTIPSGNDTNPLSEGEEGESQNNTNAQITPSVTLSTADREAFKRVFNLICPEATDKQRKKDHHLCPWQTNPNANREVPQWGDPPQLSLAVENLAGILQNNRGSPVVLQGRLCSRLTKKKFISKLD